MAVVVKAGIAENLVAATVQRPTVPNGMFMLAIMIKTGIADLPIQKPSSFNPFWGSGG